MSVRYLNSSGTQALIDLIQQSLSTKASTTTTTGLQDQITALSARIPTKVSELTNDEGYITALAVAETYATKDALVEQLNAIQANERAIATLNADEATEGSVDYKIANNIASISTAEIDALF